MSGNINDTDIHKIKNQVNEMTNEIHQLQNEEKCIEQAYFERKYDILFKTSKTLFNYILKNYGTENFNSVFFNTTLNMMLSKISAIQNNKVSQEDASVIIGTHLAEKYIPQLKKSE